MVGEEEEEEEKEEKESERRHPLSTQEHSKLDENVVHTSYDIM